MNIENKEENMTYYLYTGTYTGGMHSDLEVTGSKGIYIYRMDEETNKLHPLGVFGGDEIICCLRKMKEKIIRSFVLTASMRTEAYHWRMR